ncbi:hypothetical protein CMI38_02135 [Candidatus Pacearchaeota archaeon]|jgi:hypothetical protein|nr:hypothetical protein [Candidatus Pacearchaeota archaeon]|tara:strand:+ start:2909 stop:3208 length:300 start_codon:yes stop_codon:yes gene_type:complete
MITARNAVIPLVMGLLANIISGYLFYLNIINFNLFLYLIIGSIFVIVILITQANNYEIETRLTSQEKLQGLFMEKLKIHEQLIDIKVELRELKREVFGS